MLVWVEHFGFGLVFVRLGMAEIPEPDGNPGPETFGTGIGLGKWLWDRVWDFFKNNSRVWDGYGFSQYSPIYPIPYTRPRTIYI